MELHKKKTLKHPKADEQKRQQFLEALNNNLSEHKPIIYLDESGFKSHDCRTYGYALKGKACIGQYNWQLKNHTNAIGALYEGKLFAVNLFDCTINSGVFHYWVENTLLPELPANSVIVMDNAAFHKRVDTKELLENNGHTILWLPPYSPDLNPIEMVWAWIKQKRKLWRLDCVFTLFQRFLSDCASF